MNVTPQKQHDNGSSENYETDTQTIIRRHLEDKDHVITDEELRNVRIGMDPVDEEQQKPDNEK